MKKELCVDTYKGAKLAKKYGYDSIELNSALYLGGLTPRISLVKKIADTIDIEIVCMLRNREAGFMYSDEEFNEMMEDLEILLNENISGVAFGILTENYEIDIVKSKKIIERIHSKGKIAVFHRAFDNTLDYKKAINDLIHLKCDRVLTSGQKSSAIEGANCIKEILNIAKDDIEVIVGAGLNSSNIRDFISETGVKYVHTSCKGYEEDKTTLLNVSYRIFDNNKYQITDEIEVKKFSEECC